MKHKFGGLLILSLVFVVFSSLVFGQNRRNEKAATAASSIYVISAKAGAVNYVSGKVSLVNKDTKAGNLQKGDNVEIGEKVSTGTDGKAEVLLNPGSYIRIAENSEFEFADTSLDELNVKLNKGSSVFEVIADKKFKVTVEAGKNRFYLIQTGVYRIDVLPDGNGKIFVWKGKAQIGDINATTVKGGKSASFLGGQVAIENFERKDKYRNDLEVWSKDRAKEIAKINEKLIQREMNRSLMNTFNRNGFGSFGGYGVWVFDAAFRGYCFLPYSYGMSSPYGFGLNNSIWNYPGPASVVYNNSVNYPNGQQNQNGNFPNTPPIQPPPSNAGGNGGYNPPSSMGNPTQNDNTPIPRQTITERKNEMRPEPVSPKID